MAIFEEYLGIPKTVQKIVPGNTATGIDADIYKYKEYFLGYDASDHTFVAGDVIVGATSGARAVVISATVESGAVGTDSAAGKIRCKSVTGTWQDDEKIKIAADTDKGDVDGTPVECTDDYAYKGCTAKHLGVFVYANTALMALDGSTPDQTALLGVPMTNGSSYVIHDASEMAQAKFIDYAAGSASQVIVVGYF